jgi:hypothetical protein
VDLDVPAGEDAAGPVAPGIDRERVGDSRFTEIVDVDLVALRHPVHARGAAERRVRRCHEKAVDGQAERDADSGILERAVYRRRVGDGGVEQRLSVKVPG